MVAAWSVDRLGRPRVSAKVERAVIAARAKGKGIRKVARDLRVGVSVVQRIEAEQSAIQQVAPLVGGRARMVFCQRERASGVPPKMTAPPPVLGLARGIIFAEFWAFVGSA